MSTSVTGYTGLDIDGKASLQTGELSAIDLSAGDVVLTDAQAVNGILSVSVGHATNAVVIPAARAALYVGKLYIVVNNDAALAANIKVAGGTAVVVAPTKTATVRINSTADQVKRVTADI